MSDIHFTALFTPLYCLTFILLLYLPHCIVWHSLHCSVYLIVLSDIHFTTLFIHFTALFTPLYCLIFTLLLCLFILLLCLFIWLLCLFILLLCLFILLLCLFIWLLCLLNCFVWYSLYCSVYSFYFVNVRQYNEVHKAVKWMSDNKLR
jgi:hypothetical protein